MVNIRFNDPVQLSKKIQPVDHARVDGNLFIEAILAGLKLRNAAELSRELPVAPAIISRIRTGRAVSDELLVKLSIVYRLPISGLKDLLRACSHDGGPVTMQRVDELAAMAVFTNRIEEEESNDSLGAKNRTK